VLLEALEVTDFAGEEKVCFMAGGISRVLVRLCICAPSTYFRSGANFDEKRPGCQVSKSA
jgi:hypothetical protein